MENTKHLIVGMGEIGRPIYNILKEFYDTDSFDQKDAKQLEKVYNVIHICFGHKDNEVEDFIEWIIDYQERFLIEGGLTIIHSTVAVGTCLILNAVHSPVRGQHKMMEKGIRTFVKFFGGERSGEASEYFRKIGIKVMIFDSAKTTEAMKLFDTQYYKVCIEFAQRVKKYCDKHSLNYSDVYRLANLTYNEGYKELGYSHFTRPILEPIMTEIKGHCVMPNDKLLSLSE